LRTAWSTFCRIGIEEIDPFAKEELRSPPGIQQRPIVRLTLVDPLAHAGEEEAHAGHLTAPMSGTVVAVMVKAGNKVAKGAPLVVLEAMKMEHTIVAPAAGVVTAVNFGVGDRVAEGADLVDLADEAPQPGA